MIGYELKKLCRRPIFLLVLLSVISFKAAYTWAEISNIHPEKEYIDLVDEYSQYPLDEAERRIYIDAADAKESYFRDYETEYNDGKLTIDEFRSLQLELPSRAARYSATQRILAQVERLLSLDYEDGSSSTRNLGIRVIDETGWLLADELSNIWLCPLILVFVVVAIMCEWYDDDMFDLLRTTAKGIQRSMKTKLIMCICIILIVSIIDTSSTYFLPQLLYGLDCADAAVQSVYVYGEIVGCLTLKTYALRSMIAGVSVNTIVGFIWMFVALITKKSYRSTGILLALALLIMFIR